MERFEPILECVCTFYNSGPLYFVMDVAYDVIRSINITVPQVDHMVSLAKEGSLHARRQALAYIYDKELVHALFEQVSQRFKISQYI